MCDNSYNAELRIPGDFVYLRPVRFFIRELANILDFSQDRVNNIELAVDEVFSNAVEHGSAGSSSQIVIHCLLTEEMLKITVSDSGQGKSSNKKWLNAWSDAIKEKVRPETERGHGLLLAHSLTDEMIMSTNSMGGVDVQLLIYKEVQPVKRI